MHNLFISNALAAVCAEHFYRPSVALPITITPRATSHHLHRTREEREVRYKPEDAKSKEQKQQHFVSCIKTSSDEAILCQFR